MKVIEISNGLKGKPGIHKLQALEDILARMMNGDDDYKSMIPCNYTPVKKQEKKVA